MNPIIAVLTWPFRTAVNFVNENPTGSQIRTHVARQDPHFTETDNGIIVNLHLVRPDGRHTDVVSAAHRETRFDKGDIDMLRGYREGVMDGVTLVQEEIATVTRSAVRVQSKILRDLAREEAAAEEARNAGAQQRVQQKA